MTQKAIKEYIREGGYILSFAKNATTILKPFKSLANGRTMKYELCFSTRKKDYEAIERWLKYL